MQWVLNTAVGELTKKINAFEAMVMDLKEPIEELKGELKGSSLSTKLLWVMKCWLHHPSLRSIDEKRG
ncbi:hypothetical protein J1N35_015106 [Gossypium stocksii]|uniref:Uncharacterized protein n=1 Tax=Gossypium stocksii TaxID=47602 RepID=A0A9D3VVB3_9ROSI|nr:hypothetical protein J1N35_015106 [Gossypium stocksii]